MNILCLATKMLMLAVRENGGFCQPVRKLQRGFKILELHTDTHSTNTHTAQCFTACLQLCFSARDKRHTIAPMLLPYSLTANCVLKAHLCLKIHVIMQRLAHVSNILCALSGACFHTFNLDN